MRLPGRVDEAKEDFSRARIFREGIDMEAETADANHHQIAPGLGWVTSNAKRALFRFS